MPSKPTRQAPKTPKKRLTQAERSAGTRKILLDATIQCLFEHGYGATTTILILKYANISRGAMLHQFPSKADLMTYVVEAVFEQDLELYAKLLEGVDDRRERLLAYPQAAWEILSRPAGVAVLEILQGSRSDEVLAEKLKPVQAKIDERSKVHLYHEFSRTPFTPLIHLINGTIRGLSIMQVTTPEDEDVTEAVTLLRELLRAGIQSGILKAHQDKFFKKSAETTAALSAQT